MAWNAALKSADEGYWSFLDALVETEAVRRIRLWGSKGDALISELKRCPDVDFGTFSIDFRSDLWDFTKVTNLSIDLASLRIRFDEGPMKDELKLCVITGVIWRRAKVQTLKHKFHAAETFARALEVDPGNARLLTREAVDDHLAARRPRLSLSTLGTYASDIADFLEFHERLFGRLVDPDVVPLLRETASLCAKVAAEAEGFPCVPADYLEALMSAARATMRDGAAAPVDAIAAASLVILAEVGLRSGEFRGLEAGAIEVVAGVAGMPDIAYLTFKTYKGESGNGAYRLRRTVIGASALEAYLFLERACAKKRARIGAETLVIFPQQRTNFCSAEALLRQIRRFLVRHSREIPCVNSSTRFPDLPTMPVGEAVGQTGLKGRLSELGLSEDDELVYITPQMLRVTFATRLYALGYDLAVISKFMNHISSDTTVGYVRNDREVEREASRAVYQAMLVDGAELLGPHGEEFSALVREHAESLKGEVYEDEEALIAACAERFPLRLKPGYVCTRCGTVLKCPSDSGTDEIFCAFGVCQNQHHMYFMLDVHLEAARFHMRLVEENRARGHVMAAKNELRKARNVIEGTILPELASLDEQIARHGEAYVLERHPHLEAIVHNRERISEEVESWLRTEIAD